MKGLRNSIIILILLIVVTSCTENNKSLTVLEGSYELVFNEDISMGNLLFNETDNAFIQFYDSIKGFYITIYVGELKYKENEEFRPTFTDFEEGYDSIKKYFQYKDRRVNLEELIKYWEDDFYNKKFNTILLKNKTMGVYQLITQNNFSKYKLNINILGSLSNHNQDDIISYYHYFMNNLWLRENTKLNNELKINVLRDKYMLKIKYKDPLYLYFYFEDRDGNNDIKIDDKNKIISIEIKVSESKKGSYPDVNNKFPNDSVDISGKQGAHKDYNLKYDKFKTKYYLKEDYNEGHYFESIYNNADYSIFVKLRVNNSKVKNKNDADKINEDILRSLKMEKGR